MSDPIAHLNAALEGRYHVDRELGEGGMATVYVADDLRHGRKVALKVLKPELAAVVGAERFLAEIKTTANLSHPHILPLHDSGEADGFLFYVMPHVEGESLRKKLDRDTQLGVDEAVRIATGVAHALDHAHRHGVIHRDIKPANILLQDDEPVVADFGIALAVGAAGGGRLTETGLSLGTPHYMSPEQATGDETVGPATDIYALGCVLYETLIGEPPFTGSTPQAILGKIIMGEPVSVTGQRRSVPTNIDATVSRALEKLPADRFATARDLAEALANPSFRHGSPTGVEVGAPRGPWKPLAAGLAVAVLALAGVLAWSLTRSDGPEPVRRQLLTRLAENHQPLGDFELGPAGTGFVYSPVGGGQRWYRRWDELTARPVVGSVGGANIVTPDGAYLLESSSGEFRVIPLEGGTIRRLSVPGVEALPWWGGDGYLYFSGPDSTIHRVSQMLDGEVERLGIEREEGERTHGNFQMLPGGRRAVFVVRSVSGVARIEGYDFETGRRTVLTEGRTPRFTTTGHLVFGTPAGEIMAAALDPETLEMGPAVSMIQGVQTTATSLNWSLASDGTLAYWEAGPSGSHEMVWVTRSGAAAPVDAGWSFNPGGSNKGWALSPDDSRVAIRLVSGSNWDIWIKDLISGSERRLTLSEERDLDPHWLSDSTVLFLSQMRKSRGHPYDVFSRRADGAGEPELLHEGSASISPGEAIPGPHGEWLLIRTIGTATALGDRNIVAKRLGADEEARPLLTNPEYAEHEPALSPDGRWLAYGSDESGRDEVSVRPFPDVNAGRIPVSTDGGMSPFWSRDGTELFYVTPDRRMMAARVSTAPSFRVLSREVLFEIGPEYVGGTVTRFADVADDGRFLMMRTHSGQQRLVLVHNWFEELKRMVPH